MRYVYFHGFASGPSSRKAASFAAALREANIDLTVPDLSGGDFSGLTITGQLRLVGELLADEPCRVVGSSMGGYLAALYAAAHPEVDRLVLLAPAFGLADRWPQMLGNDGFREWREKGWMNVHHHGLGMILPVHFGLYVDASEHSQYPAVDQRALIFHGIHDDVVPVENSRAFAAANAAAKLVELDSDHELLDPLNGIVRDALDFLCAP